MSSGFCTTNYWTSPERFSKYCDKDARENVHCNTCFARSVPIILVGNKKDLSTERAVSVEAGKEFAAHMNAKFVEIR